MSRKVTIEITVSNKGLSDEEIIEFYQKHFKYSSLTPPFIKIE